MARQHIEIIDGREYVVTTVPQDWRCTPSQAKKRVLWNRLTAGQKAAEIRKRQKRAKRKRRKKS